jgi:hypothetical protein
LIPEEGTLEDLMEEVLEISKTMFAGNRFPLRSQEKGEGTIIRINVFKKKKTIFKDDILISRRDTDRLRGYLGENFAPISLTNLS